MILPELRLYVGRLERVVAARIESRLQNFFAYFKTIPAPECKASVLRKNINLDDVKELVFEQKLKEIEYCSKGNSCYNRSMKTSYRSRKDKMIAGICGGLGRLLSMGRHSTLVRVPFLVLVSSMCGHQKNYRWLVIPREPAK